MRERDDLQRFFAGVATVVGVMGGLALLMTTFYGAWPPDTENQPGLWIVLIAFVGIGVWIFMHARRQAILEDAERRAMPLVDGGFTPPFNKADQRRAHRWRTWVLGRPKLAAAIRFFAFVGLLSGGFIWLVMLRNLWSNHPDPMWQLWGWCCFAAGNLGASLTDGRAPVPPPPPIPRGPFSFP